MNFTRKEHNMIERASQIEFTRLLIKSGLCPESATQEELNAIADKADENAMRGFWDKVNQEIDKSREK